MLWRCSEGIAISSGESLFSSLEIILDGSTSQFEFEAYQEQGVGFTKENEYYMVIFVTNPLLPKYETHDQYKMASKPISKLHPLSS